MVKQNAVSGKREWRRRLFSFQTIAFVVLFILVKHEKTKANGVMSVSPILNKAQMTEEEITSLDTKQNQNHLNHEKLPKRGDNQ